VHNCKCSYLRCNFILLFSEILLLIEFRFIVSLIFLFFDSKEIGEEISFLQQYLTSWLDKKGTIGE